MKKYANRLVLLCAAVYFVSYLTRINYAAVMVEFVKSSGISKAGAALALTGTSISYGVGQLISGYLGDRTSPSRLIFIGLITAALMNFIVPFCTSAAVVTVIWTINGFAQAMMWPPIVKILTSKLEGDEYKKSCVTVSCGSTCATVFIYLFAPFMISSVNWQGVFIFSAICGLVMAFLWIYAYGRLASKIDDVAQVTTGDEQPAASARFPKIAVFVIVIVMIGITLQGMLRDAVLTWLPTFMSENFGMSSESSILSGVALPIFNVVCYNFASFINRKYIKNEMFCSAAIFGLGALFTAVLATLGTGNAVVAVASGALATGMMHGVNYIFTCVLPLYFVKYGNVTFITGLLNSSTYIGVAVSTYITALLSENLSWSGVVLVWTAIALLGAIVCCAIAKLWSKLKSY